MALFAIPLLFIVYWIIDKIQSNKADKAHDKYQEELRRLGLK
jgi:uncharacterized membrane protein (DUF485 family)